MKKKSSDHSGQGSLWAFLDNVDCVSPGVILLIRGLWKRGLLRNTHKIGCKTSTFQAWQAVITNGTPNKESWLRISTSCADNRWINPMAQPLLEMDLVVIRAQTESIYIADPTLYHFGKHAALLWQHSSQEQQSCSQQELSMADKSTHLVLKIFSSPSYSWWECL